MTTVRWALIVGDKSSQKSRVARLVADSLAARGLTVGGVIQEAVRAEGQRPSYRARRVDPPEDAALLGWRGALPEGQADERLKTFCSFMFDDDAFTTVRGWVRDASLARDVVVIDEVSKLEVAGGGHHRAIVDALGGGALPVLVVRADQLFGVVERFRLEDAIATLDAADEGAVPAFVARLEGARAS